MGPCYHQYKEGIITINSVKTEMTSDEISQFSLSQFTINDISRETKHIQIFSSDATYDGISIKCNIPCAFGTGEGNYKFQASSLGYETKVISVEASYNEFYGGCPSFNDGGVDIDITLSISN